MGIPYFFAFLAIAAEFFGSLRLLVGFLGRIAALGIIINMLIAVAAVHLPHGFFMNWTGTQQGERFEYHLLAIANWFGGVDQRFGCTVAGSCIDSATEASGRNREKTICGVEDGQVI